MSETNKDKELIAAQQAFLDAVKPVMAEFLSGPKTPIPLGGSWLNNNDILLSFHTSDMIARTKSYVQLKPGLSLSLNKQDANGLFSAFVIHLNDNAEKPQLQAITESNQEGIALEGRGYSMSMPMPLEGERKLSALQEFTALLVIHNQAKPK